jgi:hypothetical protein
MRSYRLLHVLTISILLSSLSGCAAFRSGETQPPTPWPISKEPRKQSISLLITGESSVNGTRQDVPQRMIEVWQAAAEKAYKDSGFFSNVKVGAAETDLRAELHFTDRGEANSGLAFLSGFTLTLIPANAHGEMVVKTALKTKDGHPLGRFEKKETLSFWIQFFLIFIMPFNWPNTVVTEMLYDLNRATLDQAYGAGLLRSQHVTDRQWAQGMQ